MQVSGRACYATNIGRVVACPIRAFDGSLEQVEFKEEFDLQAINQEARESFLHLDHNLQANERLRKIKEDLCEARQANQQKLLADVSGLSNPHSLVGTFGQGHEVIRAEVAAYILKCSPKEVIFASTQTVPSRSQ